MGVPTDSLIWDQAEAENQLRMHLKVYEQPR